MEDSRVAILYPELWKILAEEMRWVIDLPEHIWRSLATVSQRHWMDVRDDVIHSAHISLHFLWRRVLEPAGDLPWKLVRGDLMQNLTRLAAEECPDEPASAQLWELWHGEYPKPQLVQVLKLLGDVGWMSLPCEQQHGNLALPRWALAL